MLGYLELPEDDLPPEEIWHHDERLEEWFLAVKERREQRSQGMEPIPEATDVDMTRNELVKEITGG